MNEERLKEAAGEDIPVHIFSASATMVGVCLTVIGLFRISLRLKNIATLGDDLLAFDAIGFLASSILSYFALRIRKKRRSYKLERIAEIIFLTALSVMVVICSFIVYEFI